MNENFTALYSPPFRVPVSSSFVSLDAFFLPGELATPFNGTMGEGGGGKGNSSSVRRFQGEERRRRRRTSTFLTTSSSSSIEDDEAEKKAEAKAAAASGIVISAKLEVPLRDGSGWRSLYEGPVVRHVLEKEKEEEEEADAAAAAAAEAAGDTASRFQTADADPLDPAFHLRRSRVDFRLMAVLFSAPGMEERGFPEYRVAITVAGPSAAAVAPHLGFVIHHDRALYLWVLAVLRGILLLCTLVGGGLWLRTMRREKPEGICTWLPEQQHVACALLPALFLWQDPFALLLAFWAKPPAPVLFLSDLCHTGGYQTMLLAWVCIVDGLRCYEAPREVWLRAAFGGQQGNDKKAMNNGTSTTTSSFSSTSTAFSSSAPPQQFQGDPYLHPRLPPPPPPRSKSGSAHATWPPKHHPMGEYFGDFFLPKFALYLLSSLSIFFLCALRYPTLFFGMGIGVTDATTPLPPTIRRLYATVSFLTLVLLLLWYFLFLSAVVQTGRALRRQPYMRTRSQQLSYRFVSQEVFLVLACKVRRRGGAVFPCISIYLPPSHPPTHPPTHAPRRSPFWPWRPYGLPACCWAGGGTCNGRWNGHSGLYT